MAKEGYVYEEKRLEKYKNGMNEGLLDHGKVYEYTELNTRYLDLKNGGEHATVMTSERKKAHQQKKERIERGWHEHAKADATAIRNDHNGDAKTTEYYAGIQLSDMEKLLKDSDRGGNSDEFNDVVTDLSVYNGMIGQLEHKKIGKRYELVEKLFGSCQKYVETRQSPKTSKGKIRKAMIQRIYNEISEKKTEMEADGIARYNAFKDAYAEFERNMANADEENVNRFFRNHFELISDILQNNVVVPKNIRETLDDNMAALLFKIHGNEVEENQADCMTTRFFNALGYTDHKPQLIDKDRLNAAKQNSPLQHPMYSCIKPEDGQEDAMGFARQLAGTNDHDFDNRQYMSDGLFGKGTYVAVTSEKASTDPQDHGYIAGDADASKHAWDSYGDVNGSVQATLCFTADARIIESNKVAERIEGIIAARFPKLLRFLKSGDDVSNIEETYAHSIRKHRVYHKQDNSMFAALLGYHAIKGTMGTSNGTIDYYSIFDRNALVMVNEVMVQENGRRVSRRVDDE